jgi:hypothetical protein
MAGPLTIQRVPRGLLHAFAMKGTGDLPHDLSPTVFASYDATPLYLQDNARSVWGQSGNVAATGFYSSVTSNLIVPPGEQWILNQFSATCPVVGAGNAGWVISVGYVRKAPYTASINVLATKETLVAAGHQWVCVGATVPLGSVVLRSGDQLGINLGWGTGGASVANTAFDLWADYYRLEV